MYYLAFFSVKPLTIRGNFIALTEKAPGKLDKILSNTADVSTSSFNLVSNLGGSWIRVNKISIFPGKFPRNFNFLGNFTKNFDFSWEI